MTSQKPFLLTTDTKNEALHPVLSQGDTGSGLPTVYASRILNKTKHNYPAVEKELLAVVWGCKNFRHLYGRKFTVVSDYNPLVWIFNV